MQRTFTVFVFITVICIFAQSNADDKFDVQKHLSTVSRYGVVKNIVDDSFVPSSVPDGCTPIHLNLVARHGTRSPTKKRMRELDNLSSHLEVLIRDAEKHKMALAKLPAWLRGWKSPWKGKLKGGELISKGEDELYDLGIRIREKFPELFNDDYHPDIYTIRATQVPRAAASAVAFGIGLFSGRGSLGAGRHRAFAVTSESRASDIKLRFYDTCESYKYYRKNQEPAVDKMKEPIFDEITSALVGRYGLNFSRQDTSSLWFLCKQEASLLDITDQACSLFNNSEEASLLDITDQACSLFNNSEIALLEWTDDLEFFILKGYGKTLNYRMGVPLLKDVMQSMEEAIKAEEENYAPGSYEKARLRFAHAETVVPFSCLLGLFLEGSEFQKIQKEEPLQLPPKPPQKRNWKGSTVAPFAGNNMLVLHSCPSNTKSKYFVQVFHNENPIPLPGCDGSDLCSFEVFKEKIVAPHLKHDYNVLCNVSSELPNSKSATDSLTRWLSNYF